MIKFLLILGLGFAVASFLYRGDVSKPLVSFPYDIIVNHNNDDLVIYGKLDASHSVGSVNIRAVQFKTKKGNVAIKLNEEYSSEIAYIGPWQMHNLGEELRVIYYDDRLTLMSTDWIKIAP